MLRISILLVEDHPAVRLGIRHVLEIEEDLEVVGEAGTGEEAMLLARSLQPDVLILDVELPDCDGMDVVRWVMKENLPVRIMMLSAHNDRHYVREAWQAGACGYLTKDVALEDLVEGVRAVSRGEQVWLVGTSSYKPGRFGAASPHRLDSLSEREKEVLRAVAMGRTNREVAMELSISSKTVEKHLESIYSKLGVASRILAAVEAVRGGLV